MLKLKKGPIQINANDIKEGLGGAYPVSSLYLAFFQALPNRIFLDKVDCRAYRKWLEKEYAGQILDRCFIANRLDKDSRLAEEDDIYYFLKEERLVYLDTNRGLMNLLFQGEPDAIIKVLHEAGAHFKAKQDEKFYINLIARSHNGFNLEQMEVNKTAVNLAEHYNDDFLPIHARILERLNTEHDKGIVLLHGKPGTGKTSYIRHLIGEVKKDVIFLPLFMAGALTEPGLISILTENPNSIFVIEDAENILVGRDTHENSPVSTLLNISDGLLADCLNIQIICSFNTDLANIDRALLRKGRLIAKYDFSELSQKKAQSLSDKLGFQGQMSKAMTLADIYNPDDLEYEPSNKKAIGF